MITDPPSSPLLSRRVTAFGGSCSVPGDKSISHRALMLSSQLLGKTHLYGLLEGMDVLRTADALRSLGVSITRHGTGAWEVSGVGVGGLSESTQVLDMGNSGTSARLMMGLIASYPFTTFFTGDASLCRRPMQRVITPLAQMGAQVLARDGNRLPLAIHGTPQPMPITYTSPVASAQVKSAILLAGLNTPGVTTVIERVPTRDHTERMLEFLGFSPKVEWRDDGSVCVALRGHPETRHEERELHIPGDPSSAAFLAAAALLIPGAQLIIENVCLNPLRTGFFETLREMGAAIAFRNPRSVGGEEVADIEVKAGKLHPAQVPASRAPSMIDEFPILAVIAACTEGENVMHGLGELRVKESDRLSGIADNLTRCGVKVEIRGDDLIITGTGKPPMGGAMIATHMDHRIAMSFLVLGMVSDQPITVDDRSMIETSFPGFVALMNSLGARMEPADTGAEIKPKQGLVIAVDGPAASGKGTLARRLAEHLGYSYMDTGSLYRAVGLKLLYSKKDPHNKAAALQAARSIDLEDLANPRLRQERIGEAASIVSTYPEVREALLQLQRDFAAQGGVVLDGRDIGTVICPDADVKIFVTASLEARAKRRHRELTGEGIEVIYSSVRKELEKRDARDAERPIAPMKPAADAVIIDTTAMDAETAFRQALKLVKKRLGNEGI